MLAPSFVSSKTLLRESVGPMRASDVEAHLRRTYGADLTIWKTYISSLEGGVQGGTTSNGHHIVFDVAATRLVAHLDLVRHLLKNDYDASNALIGFRVGEMFAKRLARHVDKTTGLAYLMATFYKFHSRMQHCIHSTLREVTSSPSQDSRTYVLMDFFTLHEAGHIIFSSDRAIYERYRKLAVEAISAARPFNPFLTVVYDEDGGKQEIEATFDYQFDIGDEATIVEVSCDIFAFENWVSKLLFEREIPEHIADKIHEFAWNELGSLFFSYLIAEAHVNDCVREIGANRHYVPKPKFSISYDFTFRHSALKAHVKKISEFDPGDARITDVLAQQCIGMLAGTSLNREAGVLALNDFVSGVIGVDEAKTLEIFRDAELRYYDLSVQPS